MKNKYLNLKNALISATVAVFTGVLLLGITVALGDAPTYDPPGAGVSPTFSGLTVDGDANLTGVIQNGTNNDINPFVILDNLSIDGNTEITGDIDISGSIDNSGVNDGGLTVSDIYPGAKYIFNAVAIHGINLIGDGLIDSVGAVKITDQDGVDITGPIQNSNGDVKINDILDVIQSVKNSTGDFKIADTLNVTGNIKNSTGNVTINDLLTVINNAIFNGDIDVSGNLKKTTGDMTVRVSGPFEATDIVNIGNDTYIANNGKLTVSGESELQNNLTVSNGASDATLNVLGVAADGNLLINPFSISNFDHSLILQNGKGFPVQIGNAAKDSDLNVLGNVTATKDATITGNLTVSGNVNLSWQMAFANFNENTTGYKTITANCPGDKKILACSIYFSDANAQYARGSGSIINILGLLFGIQGCVGTYYQTANLAVPGIVTGTCI